MSSFGIIKIGTRGSPLAIRQATHVQNRLFALSPELIENYRIQLVPIITSGDKFKNILLSELGGKELFSKEIDQALQEKAIDCAVHSAKDVPTFLQNEIINAAILEREDPRDAFISKSRKKLSQLPDGATVGTTSLRRKSQLLACKKNIEVIPLRGNVQTRIDKINSGIADATFLAVSGLKRLDLQSAATEVLSINTMLPAVGQGALIVSCLKSNGKLYELLKHLNHFESATQVIAERAMLKELNGSCNTPIAGLARISQGKLTLRGLVAKPDGTKIWRCKETGAASDAQLIGEDVGRQLRFAIGEQAIHSLFNKSSSP
ncbi:MAG: hydroxymethylbilane synthase [Magnetovibrio sp.]|nr:hydroxymethylbilane synthase [Magnetovibrio sp.]|tara:strand:- start:412 stop:1368 length:957 start_codon:yes stop_codon:yes gene_type:complete